MDNESGTLNGEKKRGDFKTLNLRIFFFLFFPRSFVLSKRDLVTSRNWCADSESLSLRRGRERCEHWKAGQSYRREREGTLVPCSLAGRNGR